MDRKNWIIYVTLIGFANALIRPAIESVREAGIGDALYQGMGINFIVWFACAMSFSLLMRGDNAPLNRGDILLSLPVLGLFCIPSAMVSWVGLALFACIMLCRANGFSNKQQAGLAIMLVAALRVPISSIALKLCAPFLLGLDAQVTTTALNIFSYTSERSGNIIHGPGGHELLVMTGCTSFTNISLALLLWFTLTRIYVSRWDWRFYVVGGLVALTIFMLNIMRLALLALSVESFAYYHDGAGADIFGAAYFIITIILTGGGLYYVSQRHDAYMRFSSHSLP